LLQKTIFNQTGEIEGLKMVVK